MSKTFESLFEIGERVSVLIQSVKITGHIRAVTFTSSKVRYAVRVLGDDTTFHNIDSAFVSQVQEFEREIIVMPEDNYS